jgi:limonene-1,2-epoxide hydrolase
VALGVFEVDGGGLIIRFVDYYDMQSLVKQMEAAGLTLPG